MTLSGLPNPITYCPVSSRCNLVKKQRRNLDQDFSLLANSANCQTALFLVILPKALVGKAFTYSVTSLYNLPVVMYIKLLLEYLVRFLICKSTIGAHQNRDFFGVSLAYQIYYRAYPVGVI